MKFRRNSWHVGIFTASFTGDSRRLLLSGNMTICGYIIRWFYLLFAGLLGIVVLLLADCIVGSTLNYLLFGIRSGDESTLVTWANALSPPLALSILWGLHTIYKKLNKFCPTIEITEEEKNER